MSYWLNRLALGLITVLSTAISVKAQTLFFVYPPFNESLQVESLDTFAREGIVNQDLDFYLDLARADESAKIKFREVLNTPAVIDPLLVSRLFNSSIGEELLTRIGNSIQIQGGINGKLALRGAIVAAAFDEEGLSLINFFRKLPTNVQFDLPQILKVAKITKAVVKATKVFSEEVIPNLSLSEAEKAKPVNFANLPDLRQRGNFGVKQKRWTLTDRSRNRTFYADVYQPQKWRGRETPVVVISHGLGSKPEFFADAAIHLASHGYVVVAPQHVGSDFEQQQALLRGLSSQLFLTDEFINRPLDISYVIDTLERRNIREFDGTLVLDKVGVFGHSFGGYTALATAGATIDFEYLERECAFIGRVNISLLLQCQALNLERKDYNFRDERVAAVIAHNPVNRSIFGPQGLSKIQIPLLLGAGSYDPATPFVFEQLRSFTWLTPPNKYLVLEEGQAHVDISNLDGGLSETIKSVDKLTLPDKQLIENYGHSTGLAFSEVYVAQNQEYLSYLQSSYLQYLSKEQDFKTYLITEASSEKLVDEIEKFVREENLDKLAR